MKNILRIVTSALIAGCLAFSAGALWAQGSRLEEVSRQVFPIAPDGTVNLKNVNGGVTIQAWDQPTVEIVSTKTGPSQENMDRVKVEINADDRRIDVDTVYPKRARNLRVSVRYDLMVPSTVRLRDISTVNGSVKVDGMTFEVNAQTVNGSVKVMKSSGIINAETVNGSITAELDQINRDADMKFETVNGSIKLYLTDQVGAEVSAETVNGRLRTDFPITVRGKFGPKRMRGILGSGGSARIRLETVNGSINLSRR